MREARASDLVARVLTSNGDAHTEVNEGESRRQLRALWIAAVYTTLLLAVLDALAVPIVTYQDTPSLLLRVPLLSFLEATHRFLPNFVLLAALALCVQPPNWLRHTMLSELLPWAGAAIAVGGAFHMLAHYRPFASFLPAQGAFLGLFLVVGLMCSRGRIAIRLAGVRGFAAPALALIGAVLAGFLCARMHVDFYPTLRLTLAQIAHLLLAIALWQLAARLSVATLQRAAPPALVLAVAAGAWLSNATGALDAGLPQFRARTTLGSAHAVFHPYSAGHERATHPVPPDPRGVERFLQHAHLPALPADFQLANYNVLFVFSDTVRYDQTSLAHPELRTTPEIAGFSAEATAFTHAYAPSSGTFLSLAAMFGMSYVSTLKLETWHKPWIGEWLQPERNAAMHFSRAGYDTFWVTHGSGGAFDKVVIGLNAGFAERKLALDEPAHPEMDLRIADAAIDAIHARAANHAPFFGFVFFFSPHSPYTPRYREWPIRNDLDVYRHELRFVDEQIGRVLRAVEESGLAERTIVVVASDHGEEFGDHGGRFHKATVYTECVRVPLVIRVPGLEPSVVRAPTSIMYVLPWLMLKGPAPMREAISTHLRNEIGPMLERTSGAVISEILGYDRMKSTLIYPDLKVNYDFVADRYEVFRIDRDPMEQRDLFATDPTIASEAVERVAGYREVRAAHRQFALRPDKLDHLEMAGR